jgi:ribonuclease BN (tRNA processing enzyme)
MRVTLWGTRGSLPSAGADTLRYGGNTACVEVRGADNTLVVLDAGTGIRRLGASLQCAMTRSDILLSHLHLDHLLGIGFFRLLYEADCEVHVWVPPSTRMDLRSQMNRYFSPPLFPMSLRELPCHLELHEVPRGSFRIGGLEITCDLICHPGLTVGCRVAEDGVAMTYMPDHEPALGWAAFPGDPRWTSGYDLARGVDLLIHDAQYSADEYSRYMGYGHSSIVQAMQFAAAAGVGKLVTFHHDPNHSDVALDELLAEGRREYQPPLPVEAGTEGATFVLGQEPEPGTGRAPS